MKMKKKKTEEVLPLPVVQSALKFLQRTMPRGYNEEDELVQVIALMHRYLEEHTPKAHRG